MHIPIGNELRQICEEILAQNLSADQWAEIEADDWFQSSNYRGGFDATEGEFCFSWYADDETEYWMQFPLEQASQIASGAISAISARPADR